MQHSAPPDVKRPTTLNTLLSIQYVHAFPRGERERERDADVFQSVALSDVKLSVPM